MIRDVTIHAVLNGFVVQVGCQTTVFETGDMLLVRLGDYLRHPEQTEQQWRDTALNAKHTLLDVPTPTVNQGIGLGQCATERAPRYEGEQCATACYPDNPTPVRTR